MNRDLLNAVLASSDDDDDARLVYADWCEENGDAARARFIRVQVQRARLSPWDPQQIGLRLEEDTLIGDYAGDWIGELEPIDGITWTGFERGFPARVEADSFEALAAGRDTLAELPLAHVRTPWPQDEKLARGVAALPTLRSVRIDRAARHEEPHWFAASPLVDTLTKLTLVDDYASDEALHGLFGATRNLQTLELHRDFRIDGFRALFDAELEHLHRLSIQEPEPDDGTSYCDWSGGLKPEAIELLGGWSRLSQLEHLDLSVNRLNADEYVPLFRSPGFRVTSLRLDEVWARLNDVPWAEFDLDALSLRDNYFRYGVDGVLPVLGGLRVLDLCGTSFIHHVALESVLEHVAPSVELLDVRCSSFDGRELLDAQRQAIEALVRVDCPRLHTLLCEAPLAPNAAAEFVAWLSRHSVRSLCVDAKSQKELALALSGHDLPTLERLVLWNVDRGAKAALEESRLGKRLSERRALRFRFGRSWETARI